MNNRLSNRIESLGYTRLPGSDYHYQRAGIVVLLGPKAIHTAYDDHGQHTPLVLAECRRLADAGLPVVASLLIPARACTA